MNEKYPEWCINIICLKDGKSYILTSSSKIAENMNKILKGNIKDKNLLELEHYLLRKEILMFAQS